MTFDLLSGLALFAFVTSITPGPNNLMLMASGVNFGLRATLPHMLGIFVGFTSMIAIIGLGLSTVYDSVPGFKPALKILALGYMLWLAWKLTQTSAPNAQASSTTRPLTIFGAATFQWINPKAWSMALGANAAYAPNHDLVSVLIVTGTFGAINWPAAGVWAVLGTRLARLLKSPRRLMVFNWSMAALLLASLIPVLAA